MANRVIRACAIGALAAAMVFLSHAVAGFRPLWTSAIVFLTVIACAVVLDWLGIDRITRLEAEYRERMDGFLRHQSMSINRLEAGLNQLSERTAEERAWTYAGSRRSEGKEQVTLQQLQETVTRLEAEYRERMDDFLHRQSALMKRLEAGLDQLSEHTAGTVKEKDKFYIDLRTDTERADFTLHMPDANRSFPTKGPLGQRSLKDLIGDINSGLDFSELDFKPSTSTNEIILPGGLDGLLSKTRHAAKPRIPIRSEGERRINAWVEERANNPMDPLILDEMYTLLFNVGGEIPASLIVGDFAFIEEAEILESGLDTDWVVRSSTVRLTSNSNAVTVDERSHDTGASWTARFSLHIAHSGESERRAVLITPVKVPTTVEILIYAGNDLYREFTLDLKTAPLDAGVREETVRITDEIVHVAGRHTNLRTLHEWTTPPGRITLRMKTDQVYVTGSDGGNYDELWNFSPGALAGPIENVRKSAERFRARWENYLNAIPADEIEQRLKTHYGSDNWFGNQNFADPAHNTAWGEVAASPQLRELAVNGFRLYDRCFPQGLKLRKVLDELPEGYRLDITWFDRDRGALGSIPWSLMYRTLPGKEIDPLDFIGLRFRVAYTARPIENPSRALGDPAITNRGYCLYWGNDPTGAEAKWQQKVWSSLPNQRFVPGDDVEPKKSLMSFLNVPTPSPVSVLYLFCQCTTGRGNDPVLRFGPTSDESNTLTAAEMVMSPLADRPLVFANACTTTAADPYIANELEAGFFARGCRAYIGTETKVPIEFASRFASIFFHYFYRLVDPQPMAAGEALMQTRRFLWTNFLNIGGLFYSYLNQYELFMASDDEVKQLRR